MKYCAKCGWEMNDDETFCRNCGTKADASNDQATYTTTYYDDTPTRTLNKTTQVIIKILLILTIVAIVCTAGFYFLNALALGQDASLIEDALIDFPEFEGFIQTMDQTQIAEIFQIIFIVYGVASLIPLCWVLPMRKKIVKAMKQGTKLTTGFKICTLIFVNLIAGIVLLCSSDI